MGVDISRDDFHIGAQYGIRFSRAGAVAPSGPTGTYDDVPNLVHSYGMHLHKTAYLDGNLVRIRRTSDSVEQEFSHDSSGVLDTTAVSTFLGGSSGVIVTKHDQVGTDDITQATAAEQPLYVESGQNSKPVVRYDGSDDHLQGPFTNGGALSQPFSVLAVAQLDATVVNVGNANTLFDDHTSSNRAMFAELIGPEPDAWSIYAGSWVSGSPSDSNWNVISILFNGASSEFWLNGSSDVTGNTGTNNPTGLSLGANYQNNLPWKGDITDILIADPSWSDAERQAAEDAAGTFWGVTIA